MPVASVPNTVQQSQWKYGTHTVHIEKKKKKGPAPTVPDSKGGGGRGRVLSD